MPLGKEKLDNMVKRMRDALDKETPESMDAFFDKKNAKFRESISVNKFTKVLKDYYELERIVIERAKDVHDDTIPYESFKIEYNDWDDTIGVSFYWSPIESDCGVVFANLYVSFKFEDLKLTPLEWRRKYVDKIRKMRLKEQIEEKEKELEGLRTKLENYHVS